MSQVQFAPEVSDAEDEVLALASNTRFGLGAGRETCRETLEEYLETKTVVVSL